MNVSLGLCRISELIPTNLLSYGQAHAEHQVMSAFTVIDGPGSITFQQAVCFSESQFPSL